MQNVTQEILNKIKNPIQLPANSSTPIVVAGIHGPDPEEGQPTPITYAIGNFIKNGILTVRYEDYSYNLSLTMLRAVKVALPDAPFMPESVITIAIAFGNTNNPVTICRTYIDEINDDEDSETFTVTATGAISHYLKASQCGEMTRLTGLSHEVLTAIMDHAGVKTYEFREGTYLWTYTFKMDDTCYTSVEEVCKQFPRGGEQRDQPGFGIMETPTGNVFVGYWRHKQEILPWGAYAFSDGRDVFTKSTRISNDSCYSKIIATGKDVAGLDLEPIVIDVTNFRGVTAPPNKIFFAEFNGSTNQENLQDWATVVLSELSNAGVTKEFTGPIRPQLTVGDVAVITDDPDNWVMPNVPTEDFINSAYAITSITHRFGEDGFSTDFSADSSGVMSLVTGWTSTLRAMGYNRHQNLVDLINKIADQISTENQNKHDPTTIQYETYDPDDGHGINPKPAEKNILNFTLMPWDYQQMVYNQDGTPIV